MRFCDSILFVLIDKSVTLNVVFVCNENDLLQSPTKYDIWHFPCLPNDIGNDRDGTEVLEEFVVESLLGGN